MSTDTCVIDGREYTVPADKAGAIAEARAKWEKAVDERWAARDRMPRLDSGGDPFADLTKSFIDECRSILCA